jgi:hypothetical protein
MSYEAKSAMRWGAAIFAVAVLVTVVLVIWNARAHKSTAPNNLTKAENSAPAAKPSSLPALANVSQIPQLAPGDTCEKAEKALGKPMEKDTFSRTWETQDFVITATTDSACHLTGVSIAVTTGHKALTVDGIILGATTLADAEKILRKPPVEPSESVEAAEGHWSATLQLGPAPGMPFTAAYSAYIACDKADAMNHDPLISDFKDLPITQYNLGGWPRPSPSGTGVDVR